MFQPNEPTNMKFVPTIVETTAKGTRSWDLFSRLLEDRIILLHSAVTEDTASIIVAALLYLEAVDPEKDITLYINSPGGSVTAGMAIYDTMNLIAPDVRTVCMGMAASMGAFLLSSGTKGKRFILPRAEVMIHQPLGGASGQATEIEIAAKRIIKMKKMLTEVLTENTYGKKTFDEVAQDCERDYYLDAEEAVAYGLVDEVITKDQLKG